MKNKLGENLRRLREDNKLTQKQLAENLKLTQRKISYWERGAAEPDADTIILIAQYFEVSTDYLLGL